MDLSTKTDAAIHNWIRSHERQKATSSDLYLQLLEERVRRAQCKQKLDFEISVAHLKQAAIEQVCTTYGAMAAASGVDWPQAPRPMSSWTGHLDLLLDICHARGLPLLPAICVSQANVSECELEERALAGFAAGARRLGFAVVDARAFHHEWREKCWEWGRRQQTARP